MGTTTTGPASSARAGRFAANKLKITVQQNGFMILEMFGTRREFTRRFPATA
jgi:hypothetical protein